MHISDAPLSQRKEDGWGGSGEGTKAKLKIKWCDLHYKSITLWHLHIVYLCNSKIFFYHLPISIWACINMYKSLLRKNRIPSTALESLKGALSCFNFFSCSHETVSISAGGVLSLLAPTKTQASSTLCPTIPRYSSPQWNEWGEGSWVKAWLWLHRKGLAKPDASEEQHPCQTSG